MCSWPGTRICRSSRPTLPGAHLGTQEPTSTLLLCPLFSFSLRPLLEPSQPRPCLTQGFSSAMSWAPSSHIILSKPVSFVLLWALTSVTIYSFASEMFERILKWVRGCGKEEGKMSEFWETRPKGSAAGTSPPAQPLSTWNKLG